jgi:cell division protein FtsZ
MGTSFSIDTEAKQAVMTIAEFLLAPSEINIGYDDIKTIMDQRGPVLISTGGGTGDDRVVKACHDALNSLRKETTSMAATKVLLSITGPSNLLLEEVNRAVDIVKERTATSTEVNFGVTINDKYDDEIRVILLAGGISVNSR